MSSSVDNAGSPTGKVFLARLPAASDSCETVGPLEAPILGAVALAAAIAFGWGARNVAQDIVEKAYNRSGQMTGGSYGGADRSSAHRL